MEILHLEVNINKCNPLRGNGFTKVPKNIAKKNSVVNVLSDDGKCFAYAIMSALFPTDSLVNQKYDYPDYEEHLDFTGIELPMQMKNISEFEDLNKISINVFGLNQSNTKIQNSDNKFTLIFYIMITEIKVISFGYMIYLDLSDIK